LVGAVQTLIDNRLGGPVLLFNGVTDDRVSLAQVMARRPFILGYPVAGGQLDAAKGNLDAVLFDHVMLERRDKSNVYESMKPAVALQNELRLTE
jgi:2-dehydropantoate 2-reductase